MKEQIETIWQKTEFTEQEKLTAANTIMQVLKLLDQGKLRVAEKINNSWQTNEWLKKAILLAFKLFNNNIGVNSYDKIPLKFTNWQQEDFLNAKIRVVPGTTIRLGAYLAKNTIFMPCFINTGAFIDEGTLIDSGAVIGSCAQIGKKCHIASNAAIGGVLEPLQNSPTIIEDDCFIGVGSILAEGTIVEQGAVISMGVSIGGSTKIINRATNQISYGRVPAYSVVIPGSYTAPHSSIAINCAVIVKTVDAKTRSKTGINELLREYAST